VGRKAKFVGVLASCDLRRLALAPFVTRPGGLCFRICRGVRVVYSNIVDNTTVMCSKRKRDNMRDWSHVFMNAEFASPKQACSYPVLMQGAQNSIQRSRTVCHSPVGKRKAQERCHSRIHGGCCAVGRSHTDRQEKKKEQNKGLVRKSNEIPVFDCLRRNDESPFLLVQRSTVVCTPVRARIPYMLPLRKHSSMFAFSAHWAYEAKPRC
jgi:hypothetical protein